MGEYATYVLNLVLPLDSQLVAPRQRPEGAHHSGGAQQSALALPAERLMVGQTVGDYTIGATCRGRRRTNKVRDMIVVDRIFEIDPNRIGHTKVVITIVGGGIVYEVDNK